MSMRVVLLLLILMTGCSPQAAPPPRFQVIESHPGQPTLRLDSQSGDTWSLYADAEGSYVWREVVVHARRQPSVTPAPTDAP